MKSRFLLCVLFLCPFMSKAQFSVNQYGNVGIGCNISLMSRTRLSVGTSMPGYGACFLSGDTGALYFQADTERFYKTHSSFWLK